MKIESKLIEFNKPDSNNDIHMPGCITFENKLQPKIDFWNNYIFKDFKAGGYIKKCHIENGINIIDELEFNEVSIVNKYSEVVHKSETTLK
jgi:hypothetical protein